SVFVSLLMGRSPPTSTLFPYTTLFRSLTGAASTDDSDSFTWFDLDIDVFQNGVGARVPEGHIFELNVTAKELDGDRILRLRQHRSEEHTSELQSREKLVCRLLLEKKKK